MSGTLVSSVFLVFPLVFETFSQKCCFGHFLATTVVILNFYHMCMCVCGYGGEASRLYGTLVWLVFLVSLFFSFAQNFVITYVFWVVCVLRAELQLCFGNTEFTSDAGFAVGCILGH